jgi:hypothetical protein
VFVSIDVEAKKTLMPTMAKEKKCMDVNKDVEPNVIQHTWLERTEVLWQS